MEKRLSPTWFIEGTIDVEYKRYVLLAYLQEVARYFDQAKLYPALAELIAHHRSLTSFQQQKQAFAEKLPKALTAFDLEQLRLVYQRMEDDPEVLQEVDAIVDTALALVEDYLQAGRDLYDFVEENLRLHPIGVLPLYVDEGYLLVRVGNNRTTSAYRFRLGSFYQGEEKLRTVEMQYIANYSYTLAQTYVQMKHCLIADYPAMPNPAVYALESELAFPRQETLLPIAKRRLLYEVAA